MTSFVLLSLAFATTPAFAVVCRDFPHHSEISIEGKIGSDEILNYSLGRKCIDGIVPRLKKPVVISLSSFGGYIDKINDFVREMRKIFIKAKDRSGVMPTFVIHEECSSACIPIMSAINQMAKEGLVYLVVDARTQIGFHGCSDEVAGTTQTVFTEAGTVRYLKYFYQWGGSEEWVRRHHALFETPDVTFFNPEESEVTASGILSHAHITMWAEL